MSAIFQLMNDFDLSIGEIDAITGLTGKPKSATFRTADVVGLDLIKVAKEFMTIVLKTSDEAPSRYPILLLMEKNQWLGDKTGQGFYKKSKKGKRISRVRSQNIGIQGDSQKIL